MGNGSRLARFEATLGLFQALPYLRSLEQSIQFVANRIVRVSCHGPILPPLSAVEMPLQPCLRGMRARLPPPTDPHRTPPERLPLHSGH